MNSPYEAHTVNNTQEVFLGVVHSEHFSNTLSDRGSVKFMFTNWKAGFDILTKVAAVILIYAVDKLPPFSFWRVGSFSLRGVIELGFGDV